MQRPIMNPTFTDEGGQFADSRRGWSQLASWWAAICMVGRVLRMDVFARRSRLKIDVGTPMSRVLRGLCYRALFLPLVMALLAAVLVYTGTHPAVAVAGIDPSCRGLNFDPIRFTGEGGVQLDAWIIPLLDAQQVLKEKDGILLDHRPAVILVHDYGASRQQMLPLVRPLHDAGFVVMLPALRGSCSSPVGSTFGLNEAGDVKAAVDALRRNSFVDSSRIAIVGIGSGANAAILAAQRDPTIAALVLDQPLEDFSQTLRDRIGPQQHWMRWINPFCEWAFDVAYNVNASELNLQQSFHTLQGRGTSLRVLLFDSTSSTSFSPGRVKSIVDFLDAGRRASSNSSAH